MQGVNAALQNCQLSLITPPHGTTVSVRGNFQAPRIGMPGSNTKREKSMNTEHAAACVLSPQQQRVMDDLLPIAEIATDGSRSGLPILPRCHSLLLGPSGSGKTHLAKEIARRIGLPCLTINVGTWTLIANKSEPWTWTTIVDWLATIQTGGVIVVDEIDKLCNSHGSGGGGSYEYTSFLRLEAHELLDGTIPVSVKMPARADFDGFEIPWTEPLSPWDRDELSKLLRERVMIIACGAWQNAWKSNTRQLGFSNGPAPLPEPPSAAQISSSIDAELRQRFRDEVSFLPPMMPSDYVAVAQALVQKLPYNVRKEWREHLGAAIQRAIDGALGMRVFEELLLKAIVHSRNPKTKCLKSPGIPGLDPACPTV